MTPMPLIETQSSLLEVQEKYIKLDFFPKKLSSNCSSGHVGRSFDNSAEKIFAQSLKVVITLSFFQKIYIFFSSKCSSGSSINVPQNVRDNFGKASTEKFDGPFLHMTKSFGRGHFFVGKFLRMPTAQDIRDSAHL